MTALALQANYPTFRESTQVLGENLFSFFNPEETKSFSLDVKRKIEYEYVLEAELVKTFFECSEDNWDGYGASAISEDTLFEAFEFLVPPD